MKISDVSTVSSWSSNVGNQSEAASQSTTVKSAGEETTLDKVDQMNSEKSDAERVVIDNEMLEKAVEQANKSLSVYDRYIERSVHEKTKAIMYVMKDSKTDEVIREFPPKRIQDMIAKMWELAGLFVDGKA